MTNDNSVMMTPEDHQAAFTEVAFLVESFANTIDNIMGGATAPVGRIAGRAMAKKLPVEMKEPTLASVLETVSGRMQAGFDIASVHSGESEASLTFGRCALREVCNVRGIQAGGPLCKIFHSYFDGILNELLRKPIKSEIVEAGAGSCRIVTRCQ